MIDRLKNGRYQALCDCCFGGFDADTRQDARERMKQDGWVQDNGDICPDCQEVLGYELQCTT